MVTSVLTARKESEWCTDGGADVPWLGGQGSISEEVALRLRSEEWGCVRRPGQSNSMKSVWQAVGTLRSAAWGMVCIVSPRQI